MESLAPKIVFAQLTLYAWVRKHWVDRVTSEGTTSADKDRHRELEREYKELREILKLASALFAQAERVRRLKS